MTIDKMPKSGKEREDWIFDQVWDGFSDFSFTEIRSTYNNHTAIFNVFADALRISGVRVSVSAETEQKIADITGCSLLTPKLADLIWMQRSIHIPPFPHAVDASSDMTSNQWSLDHSKHIDEEISKSGSIGVISTVGKHWVIDNDLSKITNKAMNYGWHFVGPNFQGIRGDVTASLLMDEKGTYTRLIQGRGTRHDMHHTDYSQTCVLVSRSCLVDGVESDLFDILSNPELAPLASHQGMMSVFRQPGVPGTSGKLVLPRIVITGD